jgi:hypothetical protein
VAGAELLAAEEAQGAHRAVARAAQAQAHRVVLLTGLQVRRAGQMDREQRVQLARDRARLVRELDLAQVRRTARARTAQMAP